MYQLRIYGLPPGHDEDFEGERSAIEGARRRLKDRQTAGFAEISEKRTSRVVWSASRREDGSILESAEREPGSDDF